MAKKQTKKQRRSRVNQLAALIDFSWIKEVNPDWQMSKGNEARLYRVVAWRATVENL